jgi:quercetin 2,3-dioxygenase
MRFLLRPSTSRLHRDDGWKKSWYAFVPGQTHFGELTGFADDIVAGGGGFPLHPHRDMEISTIVTQGAQVHEDSTGGRQLVDAHTVQTMSAGTGIRHAEVNASPTEAFRSYQIWMYPKQAGAAPRYGSFTFTPEHKRNTFLLALSPDERGGSTRIGQDAFFSLSALDAGMERSYAMHLPGNGVYIHCAEGRVVVEGQVLNAGDALGVYDTASVAIRAEYASELILVETPMHRGIHV